MSLNSRFDPPRDCDLCPRLRSFILENRDVEPDWHNAPVDTWIADGGANSVSLLVVGLAPGLKGANRTGRPFTGDYAGDLLYSTLTEFGFAEGENRGEIDDGLVLTSSAITNAVRCVPPQNKPIGAEINTCRIFLSSTITRFPNLKCIVTLGKVSHDSTVRALGEKPSAFPFKHAQLHNLEKVPVVSSYHCSRYNTNTGRLTTEMFRDVFKIATGIVRGD